MRLDPGFRLIGCQFVIGIGKTYFPFYGDPGSDPLNVILIPGIFKGIGLHGCAGKTAAAFCSAKHEFVFFAYL